MTKQNSTTAPKSNSLTVSVREGEDADLQTAKFLSGPFVTNASLITKFSKGTVGDMSLDGVVGALTESAKAVKANNMAQVEELLTSQAITLNAMFGELSRRAAANMGEYIDASRQYMGMALKAQNQCRMTLETLSAIKNPPVVIARQANIAHGPQQVNNGTATASHADETGNQPNKLLETSNDRPLDAGTPSTAGGSDKALETVGEIDRPQDG